MTMPQIGKRDRICLRKKTVAIASEQLRQTTSQASVRHNSYSWVSRIYHKAPIIHPLHLLQAIERKAKTKSSSKKIIGCRATCETAMFSKR